MAPLESEVVIWFEDGRWRMRRTPSTGKVRNG